MDIQQAVEFPKRPHILKLVEKSSVAKELANIPAECAVIGGVLQDASLYLTLGEEIQAQDFTDRFHSTVWNAFETLTKNNTPIDLVTVAPEVNRFADFVGFTPQQIIEKLGMLLSGTPKADNIQHHAKLVRETAQRIRIHEAGIHIATLARDKGVSITALVDSADQNVAQACEHITMQSSNTTARTQHLEQTLLNKSGGQVPTGFYEIDEHIGGFGAGRVTILAGFSGTGKTTWALSLIRNVVKSGKRVAFFSLEMSADDIMIELIAMETGIWRSKMRSRHLSDSDWMQLRSASKQINTWDLETLDSLPRNTPLAIRRNLRRLQGMKPVDLVVVDGLWITDSDDAFAGEKDWERHQKNVKAYVRMAKDLHVPIVLLHQYSGDYKNADKPTADMLMGGQAVHNETHEIFALWRKQGGEKTLLYHLKQRGGSTRKEPFAFRYDTEFNSYETFIDYHKDIEF